MLAKYDMLRLFNNVSLFNQCPYITLHIFKLILLTQYEFKLSVNLLLNRIKQIAQAFLFVFGIISNTLIIFTHARGLYLFDIARFILSINHPI